MVETITDKTEIDKIIAEKIKGKKLIFTRYYEMSIAQKGLTHEKVLQVFPQFDKLISIEKETMKQGDIGYELFYDLSNNTSFSIATIPKDSKVLITENSMIISYFVQNSLSSQFCLNVIQLTELAISMQWNIKETCAIGLSRSSQDSLFCKDIVRYPLYVLSSF